MRKRLLRGILCAAALATGCASNDPWTPPASQPRTTLPRAPVVAPSGPESPFWWLLPDSWWPFG